MRRGCLLFSFFLLQAGAADAQSGAPKIFSTPLAGTVILREVPDKYNAQVVSFGAPEPDAAGSNAEMRALKAQVDRQFPHRRAAAQKSAKTTAVSMPVITKAFIPDSLTGIPPDNYMAVNNNNQGINVSNSQITNVKTDSGLVTLRSSLMTFSASVGLNNTRPSDNHYRYDPKVIYDAEADRFICVMLNSTDNNNWIVFAFSQTNDPGGAWNFYKVFGNYAGDTTWFDYPTVALTHNEFFLTGNKLVFGGSFKTGFRKSVIYQIRKADGYAGAATMGYRIWDSVNYGGAPIRNIFPVKGGSGLKGPEQYFLSVRNMASINDSVFLLKIGDTLGTPGNAITITPLKSNLPYGYPPDGRQPNTYIKLQTNDGRVLGAYAENNEIQFVSTTVVPATGADGIYHGRIANYATAPTVQASYITVDTMDFAYPNISYAGAQGGLNTSIISFDYSGIRHFAGVGAVMWDGTAHSPLLEVKKGDSIIRTITSTPAPNTRDSLQRWGDYTGSQPQWNLPGHVWIVGMWGKKNLGYSTWMARLRPPFVAGVSVPEVANPATPAVLYPNPAMQFIRLRFSLKEEASIHFALYTIGGSLVDGVLDARCHEGENELQFNTASLAAGQYFIRGTGANGRTLVTKRFVKQ